MYISEDTIILLIVIIGFLIFGFVMSSNRAVDWQNSKSGDTFMEWWYAFWFLIFVAFTIYGVFYR